MDLLLPKLSATMQTARVGQWFRAAGESFRAGEVLLELETDKATMDFEAPADGVLTEILATTGADLPVGAVLGRIASIGTSTLSPPGAPAPDFAVPPVQTPAADPVPPVSPTADVALIVQAAGIAAKPLLQRAFASPLARRLAAQIGVDLAQVTGTGPHARIRKRDVLAAAGPAVAAPTVPPDLASLVYPAETRMDFVPLSPLRAGIAASVTLSHRTIPAFVLDRWIETSALGRARDMLAPIVLDQTGLRLTMTDFLLQALADAIGMMPGIADRYVEQDGRPGRIVARGVNVGLVVAVPDGVMIPVLQGLQGASLGGIAAARVAAVQRARAGRLTKADTAPVGFSVSNTGRAGVDRFEALIGPGQTGILAVGREHRRVVPRADGFAVAAGINLTLSVDHRLIDGLAGAAFLGHLAEQLERGPWSSQASDPLA